MKKVGWVAFLSLILCPLLLLAQELPVNVPREETLICGVLTGRKASVGDFNIWVGWKHVDHGLQQLMVEPLWMADPVNGRIISALAEDLPTFNEDGTVMTIKLRKGVYWSDGVEFTADDVVFTITTVMKNPTMSYHAEMSQNVKNVYAKDKYTVVVEFKKPQPLFHILYLTDSWGCLRPMPKHIFEKVEDIASFKFCPPVSSGPYVLKDYDPAGNWTLWEKRNDWQRTPTGILFGEPKPKYVLFIYYPEEQKPIAMARGILDIDDMSWETMKVILSRVKTARGYHKTFPYIFNRDTAVVGITFNCAKWPYNNKDVRWALALAIDIIEFLKIAFDGAATVTPLHVPPLPHVIKWYVEPLESWLKTFAIDLGGGEKFIPYDPDVPTKLAQYAKQRGYDLPDDPKKLREIFGLGWWKYAPSAAEKLLMKNGFKRGKDGKWLLPNGQPWKIVILAHPNPAHHGNRTAFALAQCWRKFGIDTEVFVSEAYTTLADKGDYDVTTAIWPVMGYGGKYESPESLVGRLAFFKSAYMAPLGETNPGHDSRWSNPKLDQIVEQLEKLRFGDPKILEFGREALKILVEELPTIPTNLYQGITVFNEAYWKNWPTAENPYLTPYCHWASFKYVLPFLEKAKK